MHSRISRQMDFPRGILEKKCLEVQYYFQVNYLRKFNCWFDVNPFSNLIKTWQAILVETLLCWPNLLETVYSIYPSNKYQINIKIYTFTEHSSYKLNLHEIGWNRLPGNRRLLPPHRATTTHRRAFFVCSELEIRISFYVCIYFNFVSAALRICFFSVCVFGEMRMRGLWYAWYIGAESCTTCNARYTRSGVKRSGDLLLYVWYVHRLIWKRTLY